MTGPLKKSDASKLLDQVVALLSSNNNNFGEFEATAEAIRNQGEKYTKNLVEPFVGEVESKGNMELFTGAKAEAKLKELTKSILRVLKPATNDIQTGAEVSKIHTMRVSNSSIVDNFIKADLTKYTAEENKFDIKLFLDIFKQKEKALNPSNKNLTLKNLAQNSPAFAMITVESKNPAFYQTTCALLAKLSKSKKWYNKKKGTDVYTFNSAQLEKVISQLDKIYANPRNKESLEKISPIELGKIMGRKLRSSNPKEPLTLDSNNLALIMVGSISKAYGIVKDKDIKLQKSKPNAPKQNLKQGQSRSM